MTLDQATHILTAGFGRETRATAVKPTVGGMVSSVWEVHFDRPPGRAALKISTDPAAFTGERAGLEHLRRHTAFPVPEPYFLWRAETDGDRNASEVRSVLALEWIRGLPMGEVALTDRKYVIL